jgi:hypothetical protein
VKIKVGITTLATVGTVVGTLLGTLLLSACEEKKTNKLLLGRQVVECDMTMDNLVGTEWVIEKINPDKSLERDIQTRLKIYAKDGATRVKYNVGSLSDMYDYECQTRAGELACWEDPPKVRDFCQSLLAVEKECTAEILKKLAPTASDEDIAKGIEDANANVTKYKGTDKWKAFVFQNNNLGNKLGGLLYLKFDERRCKLRITDNYMTIYDGKKIEDSNPVGTNYFLKNEETLMWETCTDSGDLVATTSADFPKTAEAAATCAPPRCTIEAGTAVTYHYIGQDGRTPKDGCTYSFDSWLNWRPLQSGVTAEIVDWKKGRKKVKEIRYPLTHTFAQTGKHVMEIVRYETCEGKAKEQVEVACNLILVK